MVSKIWNWQSKKWPHFSYNEKSLKELELKFSQNTGTVLGAFKHVNDNEKKLCRSFLLYNAFQEFISVFR